MSGLRFIDADFLGMRTALLADAPLEACALAFATFDPASGRFIVKDVQVVPAASYVVRGPVSAVLESQVVVAAGNRCRASGESAIFIHTHPFDPGVPAFSPIDDGGEAELARFMGRRGGAGPHAAMVLGPNGCRARRLGGGGEMPVWQVGRDLVRLTDDGDCSAAGERHDRQVRALGEEGQRILSSLHVGVVGLGGTGSVVAQQLAHLGVGRMTLVDPDVIEATNLNRVVGATGLDVGRPKVEVAATAIRAINPACSVDAIRGDVVDQAVVDRLTPLDVVFSCTDSHASRLVTCHLAYQHLVPVFDMGVGIQVADGSVTHVAGRAQMLAPGLECLVCAGTLDFEAIRRETMTAAQRAADPYVQGAHVPQPAVISINSTMASLAITMFLAAVAGLPAASRFQRYDAIRGTVRPASAQRDPHCIVCSREGALARGRSSAMPVRPYPAGSATS